MKQDKIYYVYILASKRNGTLYVGISSNLRERVNQHKNEVYDSFTKKYKIKNLVYFETYNDVKTAIKREKQLKAWKRQWKIELIEKDNPCWKDLAAELIYFELRN